MVQSLEIYRLFWLQETFERNGASRFWRHFDPYSHVGGLNKNDDLDVSVFDPYLTSFYLFFSRCGECLVVLREWLKQIDEDEIQSVLYNALEEVTLEKQYQEKCLLMLVHGLQSYKEQMSEDKHDFEGERNYLTSKYQWIVASVLMATLPRHFPGLFHFDRLTMVCYK